MKRLKAKKLISTFWGGKYYLHHLHSGKLTLAIRNGPFEDVFPTQNGEEIHCHVSLPEGKFHQKIHPILPPVLFSSLPHALQSCKAVPPRWDESLAFDGVPRYEEKTAGK